VCLCAGLFVALATGGGSHSSATWDEPIHLTAGYAALTRGDFRVDPSHPPLLRMWAALPILALRPSVDIDTAAIDGAAPATWLSEAYGFAHRFMYVENDADRMLAGARMMIVLLGAALAVIVFSWARAWLGLVPAITALLLCALEPNLLAHGSLVTTDLGVTVFAFAAIFFLWRTCERPTRLNALAAACCSALAVVSKFSAILLAPIIIVLLLIAVARRALSFRTAAAVAGVMAVTAIAGIWAVYGFRYLPSESPGWVFDFTTRPAGADPSMVREIAGWVDRHHLLPNAYTQGFVYAQTSSQQMPSFLAGERSTEGWWYYFPIALLIKTPLALLLLLALGVAVTLRQARALGVQTLAFVFVPIVVFLGAAMASGINLGLRHVLPIYPFLILIAAMSVKGLLDSGRRWAPIALTVVIAGGAIELARVYPNPLAFFNQLVGGPAYGYRYLADSNLDWGSNLKRLREWMARNRVEHVNLAYFGQADPEYYDIDCTHLPGAPGFATDAIARPRLPGYVAISPTIMQGVYAPPQWQLFYEPFANLEPAAVLGHSLRVYWVEEWPVVTGTERLGAAAIDARRLLADALMLGMRWPEPAVTYYRDYLRHRPRDGDALLDLGIALAAAGRIPEVVPTLESAVKVAPDHGRARLTLARALFASGNVPGAAIHAERAADLLPADADAQDFLGRVRGAQGRLGEALTAFGRALQIEPSHQEARKHMAILTQRR
jgi:tetratricopeptide (TPR) repeat protein